MTVERPGAGTLLSVDELMRVQQLQHLRWSSAPLRTPLFRLAPEHASRALRMSERIRRYCGDTEPGGGDAAAADQQERGGWAAETARALLQQALAHPELHDELYLQLVRQTRGNPGAASRARAWGLLHLAVAAAPPSSDFAEFVGEYVLSSLAELQEGGGGEAARQAAATLALLESGAHRRPRQTPPSAVEVAAHLADAQLSVTVRLLDGTSVELPYGIATSVADATGQLVRLAGLDRTSSFALYQAPDPLGGPQDPACEELLLLEEHQFVADVVAAGWGAEGQHGRQKQLLFKKCVFRASEGEAASPRCAQLSYLQARQDLLAGFYPLGQDEAAQLAALQLMADHGSAFEGADADALAAAVEQLLPRRLLATRLQQEWQVDVHMRYQHLVRRHTTADAARQQFVLALGASPCGAATFFAVRPSHDPTGALPPRVLLSVSARGVRLLEPAAKEPLLLAAGLRDISRYGCSSRDVFLKMRPVAGGAPKVFFLATRRGEEVCAALHALIDDELARRAGGKAQAPTAVTDVKAPSEVAAVLAMMQQQQTAGPHLTPPPGSSPDDVQPGGLQEHDQLCSTPKAQVGTPKAQVGTPKAQIGTPQRSAGRSAEVRWGRLAELERLLEDKHRELQEAKAQAAAAGRAAAAAAGQRRLLQDTLTQLEKAWQSEIKELEELHAEMETVQRLEELYADRWVGVC